METTVNKSEKNDQGEKHKLIFENEAYADDDAKKPNTNDGVNPMDILSAQKVGVKWKHLTSSRRITRQYTRNPVDFLTCNLGLDEDIGTFSSKKQYDPSQAQLNKKLISHFASLARNNDSDDEVDLDLVDQLIRQGADVNCRDKHGQGMLHEAARAWHTDIVLFLLQHGAEVNMADKFKRTPLHVAAAVDYPEMVELLIENGADIGALTKEENQTPLHFAARNDAVESSKVLMKLGADLEAKDYKQRTPTFVASELDRSETARYLIDMNADVSVVDSSGLICMTHMITKMGPVARSALDQFHRKDRANRKQYFFLNLLEVPRQEKGDKISLAKTPLEVIVNYRQLDLIMHPVIMRLIDVKWEQFGRRIAFRSLLINLIFVLTWTILGVGYPWYLRPFYVFPQDGWRVFLLVLGSLLTIFEVYGEVNEIISSRKKFYEWKAWREQEIQRDINFCHPKWPAEKRYLQREMDTLDDMLPTYFQDFWNYFDWVVYFFIFFVVVLHIADASLPASLRHPPCCTVDFVCNDTSVSICNIGVVNNASLSVWNNRFFVLLIIFLWLRLMKFTRAFRFFGPFIVMLGKLTWDILRFLYLYLEFYIPYACAFWMIFGNIGSVPSMSTVDQMLFSLFRITLVDDYEFQEMHAYDVVMAYILIGTFLGISAILCLNLFIALLSDTFQRVYDNANANAVMQQAALLLNFEENLSKRSKKLFRKYLIEKCSPEAMYYDDDLTVAQDADLKKVTIQIKEQMDELMEHVEKAERHNKAFQDYSEPSVRSSMEDGEASKAARRTSVNEDDFTSPRAGKIKPKPSVRLNDVLGLATSRDPLSGTATGGPASNDTMHKVANKMGEFTSRLQRLQVSQTLQEQSYKRLRDDIKDIKEMLVTLMPGGQAVRNQTSLFASPTMSLSNVVDQAAKAKAEDTSDATKSTGLFRRFLGPQKPNRKAVTPRSEEEIALPHFVPATTFQRPMTSASGDELISLHESPTSRFGGTNPPGPSLTVAGVRTADITVRPPSENETAGNNDSNA